MDTHTDDQEKIVEEDDDGGWVDTHHFDPTHNELSEQIGELNLDMVGEPVYELALCLFPKAVV